MSYVTEIVDWKTAGAFSDIPNIIWFVVKKDNNILGRAGIRLVGKNIKENEAHFYRAIIEPKYRGKGLYSLLINARIEYVKQQGKKVIISMCNEKSLPILLGKNFEEFGTEGQFTLVKFIIN